MKLRLLVKLGAALSVILLCIGTVFYNFARLRTTSKYENFDFLCFVPNDCCGLIEFDNIGHFIHESPYMTYAMQLDTMQHAGLIKDLLGDLSSHSFASVDGLGSRMNHLVISFHSSGNTDVVAYLWLGRNVKKLLVDAMRRKYGADFACKQENYRGESIEVYPLTPTQYFSVYREGEILAVSYQKRLIEKVIDARKDSTSLHENKIIGPVRQPKSVNRMTVYSRTPSLPCLAIDDSDVWSEYDVRFGSDAFYMSGAMYASDSCIREMTDSLDEVKPVFLKDSILIVSGLQNVDSYISGVIASPVHSFFDECTVNLSRDASYIMVADMDEVIRHPEKYVSYIPGFVSCHLNLFRPFVFSMQITRSEDRLSHILIFTYKKSKI